MDFVIQRFFCVHRTFLVFLYVPDFSNHTRSNGLDQGMGMKDFMEECVYIRLKYRAQIKPNTPILLKDIANIIGNEDVTEKVGELVLGEFSKDKDVFILDVTVVLQTIFRHYPKLTMDTYGPSQTIVEVIRKRKKVSKVGFILVWLILFVGAAFAIMNFHEDVSMRQMHERLYFMITGEHSSHPLIFQIPYSIGLGLGMILFFNHLFKKKFNDEPSPMEVEMFNYQQELDQYLIMKENKMYSSFLDDD